MITVSIATLFTRKESLADLLNSIVNKVDKINIFAHDYIPDNLPEILNHPKINIVYDYEYGDKGDLDKFHWLDDVKEGYHFILDDDLILPEDYFTKSIEYLEKYPEEVLSYHGADIYKPPIANYYTDRLTYPVLGDVLNEIENPSVLGTGCMFYNAERVDLSDFKKYCSDKIKNMADIHFAVYANKNKIKRRIIPHLEGWVRHSERVDLNETIYAKASVNPYYMTKEINDNADYFENFIILSEFKPKITVGVVTTRLHNKPHYVKQCFDSIRNQSYDNIEIIVINNEDKLITIGKAFNTIAKKATGEYVLFIGDDDYISPDYIQTLVSTLYQHYEDKMIAGVSSYLTMFKSSGENILAEHRELVPTGMWKRDLIVEKGFKEFLTKYVDSEFAERIKAEGYKQIVAEHCYGYFYRSHPNQVSGHKTFKNEEGQSFDHNQFTNYLQKLEVENVN